MATENARFRRLSIVVIAMVCIAASTIGPIAPSDAQTTSFGNGNHRGALSFSGLARISPDDEEEVVAHFDAHGSFLLSSTDGATSGEWNLQVTSVVLGTNGTATANAIGFIEGEGPTHTLELDRLTVTEPSVGIELEFAANELPNPGAGTIVITGQSCNAVTGTWLIPMGSAFLEGTFITEPLRPGVTSTQADLQDEGLRLIELASEGVVDPVDLAAFISRAEEQANNETLRREDCDDATAAQFSSLATSLLDAVLVQTGYASEDADDVTFVALFRVALRSGLFVFNPGARLTFEFELLQRLADAITLGDRADWEFWMPVAREFGETRAEELLARQICRDDDRSDCGDF